MGSGIGRCHRTLKLHGHAVDIDNCIFYHCCSVAQSCLTLCDPMDCSLPSFPVLHHLLGIAQSHVHWVSDAIEPSRPLLSPSPLAFSLFQHQGFFSDESALHIRWPKYILFKNLRRLWLQKEVIEKTWPPVDWRAGSGWTIRDSSPHLLVLEDIFCPLFPQWELFSRMQTLESNTLLKLSRWCMWLNSNKASIETFNILAATWVEIYSSLGCPGPVSYVSYLAYQTCQLPTWNGLSLSWDCLCMPGMRTSFRFYLGRSWCFEPTMAWGCVISLKVVEQNNPQLTTIAWGVVSVCLPSYALSPCLPSYLGFFYFARGLSLHGCSSKAQLLLLTLEVWLLLSATAPDLGRRVAPFGQSWSCAIVAAALLQETVEVRNRFKGLDLIDRVRDEIRMEVHDV